MAGLLRLATVGSVDDGKSTLVGRLLRDTRSVLTDQLAAVEWASAARRGHRGHPGREEDSIDLALFTDGLRAERQRHITIDVAYQYLASGTRGLVLADTPGHLRYLGNTITGISTAHAVIVLVNARKGMVEQTRRHTAIAALLGVPHLVLAVNKMDLVGYDRGVYEEITARFADWWARLGPAPCQVTTIPLSALTGENVVHPARRMPWYSGPSLLAHVEALPPADPSLGLPLRMPVQYVLRAGAAEAGADRDYQGYAGQIVSGVARPGDEIIVQPSGVRTRITAIDGPDGPLAEAFPPMSVTIRVAGDLGIARGDLVADAGRPGRVTTDLTGLVCWLASRAARDGERVLLRVGTRTVSARVTTIHHRLDIGTLDRMPADEIRPNDLVSISVQTAEPVAVDEYLHCRGTGAFLLIDVDDGSTLAAGMVGESGGDGTLVRPGKR